MTSLKYTGFEFSLLINGQILFFGHTVQTEHGIYYTVISKSAKYMSHVRKMKHFPIPFVFNLQNAMHNVYAAARHLISTSFVI